MLYDYPIAVWPTFRYFLSFEFRRLVHDNRGTKRSFIAWVGWARWASSALTPGGSVWDALTDLATKHSLSPPMTSELQLTPSLQPPQPQRDTEQHNTAQHKEHAYVIGCQVKEALWNT